MLTDFCRDVGLPDRRRVRGLNLFVKFVLQSTDRSAWLDPAYLMNTCIWTAFFFFPNEIVREIFTYTFSADLGALHGPLTLYMLPALGHRLVENSFQVGETGVTCYIFLPDLLFCQNYVH